MSAAATPRDSGRHLPRAGREARVHLSHRAGWVARAARPLAAAAALMLAGAAGAQPPEPAAAERANGFELASRSIDVREIRSGGPPRDGIPALDGPEAEAAASASWPDDVYVIGVSQGGEARAYPLPILEHHELANDTVGGRPLVVSYCPLCGTGLVFDRRVAGRERSFGVSGLLYRSGLLLYDRETESLWSQITARAVTGPSEGQRLTLLPSRVQTWGQWRRAHPQTTVLSRDTGHARPYGSSPYGDYPLSERLLVPVDYDRRYHPKSPTVGLRIAGGAARGYPARELVRAGGAVREDFEGRAVSVAYDPELQVFRVEVPGDVEVVEGYWFAWSAFHPEAGVFEAPSD